jgi:serine protease Do
MSPVPGERVYSIGTPAGLELTMTDGLLSGKRLTSGQHFVQTSAPISPGSSGGGLFDEAGNLIGITTFRLKDSENLNLAISAEDYLLR